LAQLRHQRDSFSVSEEVVKTAAKNTGLYGPQIMSFSYNTEKVARDDVDLAVFLLFPSLTLSLKDPHHVLRRQ
jgi:hypothetical protein